MPRPLRNCGRRAPCLSCGGGVPQILAAAPDWQFGRSGHGPQLSAYGRICIDLERHGGSRGTVPRDQDPSGGSTARHMHVSSPQMIARRGLRTSFPRYACSLRSMPADAVKTGSLAWLVRGSSAQPSDHVLQPLPRCDFRHNRRLTSIPERNVNVRKLSQSTSGCAIATIRGAADVCSRRVRGNRATAALRPHRRTGGAQRGLPTAAVAAMHCSTLGFAPRAALAQLVEHIIRNDGVACSSHASGTSSSVPVPG